MKNFFLSNIRNIFLHTILLLLLIIGIQNSNNKSKVTFLTLQSINMPVSFIIGTSFLCGSFYGNIIFSFLELEESKKNLFLQR